MPDGMSEDMTDRMPEDMPDRMPDRMSEGIPDRMSDGMNWMPWSESLEAKYFFYTVCFVEVLLLLHKHMVVVWGYSFAVALNFLTEYSTVLQQTSIGALRAFSLSNATRYKVLSCMLCWRKKTFASSCHSSLENSTLFNTLYKSSTAFESSWSIIVFKVGLHENSFPRMLYVLHSLPLLLFQFNVEQVPCSNIIHIVHHVAKKKIPKFFPNIKVNTLMWKMQLKVKYLSKSRFSKP